MLRIGIVAGGRIVEEKLVKPGRAVTVGEHPRSTVVVPKAELPERRFALFGARDGGWELRFTPELRGKVTVDGEVFALGALLERGDATRRRGVWTLPLGEGTRGKVHVGDFTFLFQLVAPPPLPARDPRRGFGVRRSPPDMLFLATLAFSGLLHVAGLIWIEAQPPPRKVQLTDLPEPVRQWVFAPETQEVPPEEDATPIEASDPEATPAEEPEPTPEPDAAAAGPDDVPPVEKSAEQRLADAGWEWAIVGSTYEDAKGDPVADYLDDPSGLAPDVRQALLDGNVTIGRRAPEDLGPKFRTDDDGIVASDADPRSMGGGQGGDVVKERAAPRPQVMPGPVDAAPEVASTVAAILKPYRGRIKACYEREIKTYPDLAGKLTLSWIVTVTGGVEEVVAELNTTGSGDLETCVKRVVRGIDFPAGDQETFVDGYPLIFSPQ